MRGATSGLLLLVVVAGAMAADQDPGDRAEAAAVRAEAAAERSEAAARRIEDAAARLERLIDSLERRSERPHARRKE